MWDEATKEMQVQWARLRGGMGRIVPLVRRVIKLRLDGAYEKAVAENTDAAGVVDWEAAADRFVALVRPSAPAKPMAPSHFRAFGGGEKAKQRVEATRVALGLAPTDPALTDGEVLRRWKGRSGLLLLAGIQNFMIEKQFPPKVLDATVEDWLGVDIAACMYVFQQLRGVVHVEQDCTPTKPTMPVWHVQQDPTLQRAVTAAVLAQPVSGVMREVQTASHAPLVNGVLRVVRLALHVQLARTVLVRARRAAPSVVRVGTAMKAVQAAMHAQLAHGVMLVLTAATSVRRVASVLRAVQAAPCALRVLGVTLVLALATRAQQARGALKAQARVMLAQPVRGAMRVPLDAPSVQQEATVTRVARAAVLAQQAQQLHHLALQVVQHALLVSGVMKVR